MAAPVSPTAERRRRRERHRSFAQLGSKYIDLRKAILAYAVLVVVTFFITFALWRIRAWSAIVISLFLGQIVLTAIFMPVRLDFWHEYDSFVAAYGFIQLFTPLVIAVYAVARAVTDVRAPRHLDNAPPAHAILRRP